MYRGRNYFSSNRGGGGYRGNYRGSENNRERENNRGHRDNSHHEHHSYHEPQHNRGPRESHREHQSYREPENSRGHREHHNYREQQPENSRGHRERENNRAHHGNNQREHRCLVSAFKINVRPKSIVYNYEVNIVFRLENNASERQLSKKGDRDFCRHIVQNVCTFDQDDYVYDGKALLWSNKLLSGELSYSLPSADFDELTAGKLKDVGTLFIGLKLVDQFDLSEFDRYLKGDNLIEERRSQRNVCELILSQSALNRGDFTLGGIGQLFDVVEKNFYGLVTREGNSKGVHVVDDDGHPQLIMSLEYSKKIFYPGDLNLLTFYEKLRREEWRSDDLSKLFSGLKLSLTYNPGRIITFDKFTKVPLEKLTVGEVSMVQFYENQWNIKLEHTYAKAVVSKNNCGTFPMELLTVVPNQSVPNDRLPEDLQATALEINRLKTNDRHARIMKQFERLGLNLNDSVCKSFGVEVEGKMMEGPFFRLPKTVVLVRLNQQLTVDDYGSFRFERNQYLIPSRISRLVVLASRRDKDKAMASVSFLKKETQNKGMIIDDIEYQEFNTGSRELDYWVHHFRSLQDAFVIVIDNVGDSHPLLKLAAAITGVETQHVKWDTASLMSNGGRGQTRENIVHQVNVKSGGLNHKVLFDKDIQNLNMDNGNILVIGIDVCHPTGCNFRGETAVPSTVGIVGNYNENPNSFSGTFFFQKSRQEHIDSYFLQKSVKKMLAANPRSEQIDTIVILRDGVSEGQYAKVLNDEIQAVKRGASDFFGHPDTSIVCIIVTKNGNARHFDITNRDVRSLPPRSVVNFGCRYNFKQFYLVCHRAFQGTAKAVMCTVVRDDLVCEMIEVEKFIMALTNLHQIVCAPISLPEPIYQADKLAQRGHEIFTALKQYSPQSIKYDENDCIKLQELSTNIGFNFGK